jgi:serine protease
LGRSRFSPFIVGRLVNAELKRFPSCRHSLVEEFGSRDQDWGKGAGRLLEKESHMRKLNIAVGVLFSVLVAPEVLAGGGALASRGPSSDEPKATPNELIVLLAVGAGVPRAEEVLDRAQKGLPLPARLDVGNPTRVEFALIRRTDDNMRKLIEAAPESPRARLERYLLLTFPEDANLEAIQAALERNPNVLHIERNYLFDFHVTPMDPLFPGTATTPPVDYQWGSHTLKLPEAWEYAKGHAYVGLIDNGVQISHPDLSAFADNGVTYQGGNFRPHLSWDTVNSFVCQDERTHDRCIDELEDGGFFCRDREGVQRRCVGHGTHVAGIVAATANNGRGVTGACWNCSILMAIGNQFGSQLTTATAANSLTWLVDHGVQVVSMSFGENLSCEPPSTGVSFFCDALAHAEAFDVLMTASPGNDKRDIEFPASDLRVISVGGVEPDGAFWDRLDEEGGCPCDNPDIGGRRDFREPCRQVPTLECGSNFTFTPGSAMQDLVAPAKQVLSTFYENQTWNESLGCQDTSHAGVGYDLCTGTSMSSPYVAAVAGILRSVNPLLSKAQIQDLLTSNADRAGNWDPRFGFGVPDAEASVKDTLGRVGGAVLSNRLTPLFSLYSNIAEDHFYTTVPQMAAAAMSGTLQQSCVGYSDGRCTDPLIVYQPVGPAVPGFGRFPGIACAFSPCTNAIPRASVYVFSTDRSPNGMPLVPLYRMTFKGPDPNNPVNANNRDTTYTTEAAGIEFFNRPIVERPEISYKLDGIEGYIYKKCTPELSCIPAGAVRLLRRYNPQHDDYAIFPESELAQMESQGYTSNGDGLPVLGYVYPNLDSDDDHVIDGFESLLGTDQQRADSDCDGLSDGAEILGFPYTDPRIANSGPGCVPPVANFSFVCAGLSCSFNGAASTGTGLNYSWSFGDSSPNGSGVTTTHLYPATPGLAFYTATLTVTDFLGRQSSKSKSVAVNGDPIPAAHSYFAVAPCRILSTTVGNFQPLVVNIAGLCGIPSTAKAVSFNVTAVAPTTSGKIRLYPGDLTASWQGAMSSINFAPATSPRANSAVIRLATNGAGTLGIFPELSGQVQLLLDVQGYFSMAASPAPGAQGPLGFQTLAPCRMADTRLTSTPLVSGTVRTFTAQGVCNVPVGTTAASLHIGVPGPASGGHITLYPSNIGTPGVSTISFPGGISHLRNGARVNLSPSTPDFAAVFSGTAGASVHAYFDVNGYFKSDAPLKYHPIIPCRSVSAILATGTVSTFQIQGNCGIPVGAKAALVRLVISGPTSSGDLTVYPSNLPLSGVAVSTVKFDANEPGLSMGTIVPLSTLADDLAASPGQMTAGGTVGLSIDVFGYFQ